MITKEWVNDIYYREGFDGVINLVRNFLQYGEVKQKDKNEGIYCITTGGYSKDESVVYTLTQFTIFGSRHYIGSICGGVYYYVKEPKRKYTIVNEDTYNLLKNWYFHIW